MATFLLTLLIVLASLAGLGVGVLLGRSAPAGSCGGLACGACSQAGSPACKKHRRPDRHDRPDKAAP